MDVDGQQVASLWLDGNLCKIIEYNEFDALTTYLVWLGVAHFGGHFTGEQYKNEQQLVKELIGTESVRNGKEYLMNFLEEWERLKGMADVLKT